MGAISRHCTIGDATTRAFLAGSDMMLICARPDVIRAGYDALLKAAASGRVPKERLRPSLRRIAALKAIVKPPLALDLEKVASLADEIEHLNQKLGYTYGGTVV
jgi:beta-N-acetylhexosaminidase